MKRVVFNQKGGVGKSTIVCNLAAIGAARGRSSLVIDLDPQGNSSQYLLGEEWRQKDLNIAKYFEQTLSFKLAGSDPADFCVETPFPELWIMPASAELGELQAKLESKHKIFKLREALNQLSEEVDDIYVDTPPAYNFYTLSALIAADRCLIPFDCDEFARKALYQLLDNVAEARADHNPKLEVEGIIVNQFQARSKLPARIVEQLEEDNLPVLDTKISSSVAVKESHEACAPMIHFRPKHKITQEYIALYDEISEA